MFRIIPHYWPNGEQVAGGYSLRIEAPADIQQIWATADEKRRKSIWLEHALSVAGTVGFGMRDGHIPNDVDIKHDEAELGSEIEIPDLTPEQVTRIFAGQESLSALYLDRMREYVRT